MNLGLKIYCWISLIILWFFLFASAWATVMLLFDLQFMKFLGGLFIMGISVPVYILATLKLVED